MEEELFVPLNISGVIGQVFFAEHRDNMFFWIPDIRFENEIYDTKNRRNIPPVFFNTI